MAEDIRDRARAAIANHGETGKSDRGAFGAVIAWLVMILELLLGLADSVHVYQRENRASFKLIKRMERKIMADDDAVVSEIQAMADTQTAQAAAIAGMAKNVDAVLAQLEAGNTQGAKDEATKLKAALDPVKAAMDSNADALNAAAQKLAASQPAPTPEPPVDNPPVDAATSAARGQRKPQG